MRLTAGETSMLHVDVYSKLKMTAKAINFHCINMHLPYDGFRKAALG